MSTSIKNVAIEKIARDEIVNFCNSSKSRQRKDLYDLLDKNLGITIDRAAYNYGDQRIDNARFECSNQAEFDTVIQRVIRELEKKSR